MAKVKLKEIGISLFGGTVTWAPDDDEQKAAWEMYVELVTRIAIQKLDPNEGLIREAMTSLYVMFGETRRILREYGPGIAKPGKKKEVSFGEIAVAVLNKWLRPYLAKWHPLLLDYENKKPAGKSQYEHERAWEHASTVRDELAKLQGQLVQYADVLAEVCGIAPLHKDKPMDVTEDR